LSVVKNISSWIIVTSCAF